MKKKKKINLTLPKIMVSPTIELTVSLGSDTNK